MAQTYKYKLFNNRTNPSKTTLVKGVDVSHRLNTLDYVAMLRAHYLIVLISILTCALAGMAAALLKTPTYEATMLLQVGPAFSRKIGSFGEERNGQENNINVASETEIIKSRAVIGAAANDLALYINARPNYFPIIGRFFAAKSDVSRTIIFPMFEKYCWGNEYIDVRAFDVPNSLLDKKFEISLQRGGYYTLHSYATRESFVGHIGIARKFHSKLGNINLHVGSVFGQEGQSFILLRRPEISVIEDLQASLTVSESAKASNMIRVAFKGSSPAATYSFLKRSEERRVGKECPV